MNVVSYVEWNLESMGSGLLSDYLSLSKPWATQENGTEAHKADDVSTFKTLLSPGGCNPFIC